MKSAIISVEELNAKIVNLKSKLLQLRLTFWQGKTVDTSSFKKIKREVARAKTAIMISKKLKGE